MIGTKLEARRILDSRLGQALRESGITEDDARAIRVVYAVAGYAGASRIVAAMRAIEAWAQARREHEHGRR